jgi:hypothetical protein
MDLQDGGDVGSAFTRIRTIELSRVHINGHSSDAVIRQVLTHTVPAAGALRAAVHHCDGLGLAGHSPMLPKPVASMLAMNEQFPTLREGRAQREKRRSRN